MNNQNREQFYRLMATEPETYNEEQQTVQFYKVKLMEKERVISNFQATLKKQQLMTNRQIKELKMTAEKAKNQLKQEKSKVDKFTKSSLKATEQNKILQHRMNQIKDEKDKEIQSIRNQYNHLKAQVRSYQRILPTLTFMNNLGAQIEQLPTYQQIFSNLQERVSRCENLEVKLKATKEEMNEKIDMHLKIEQNLKKTKIQLEKNQRDQLTKMFELQSQISTLQVDLQEERARLEQLSDKYEELFETHQNIAQDNKLLSATLDEERTNFHAQLQSRDDQLKKFAEQYLTKHQGELAQLKHEYEIRQQTRFQQLIELEQNQRSLLQKIDSDKDRLEDTTREYENYINKIKGELQQQSQDKERFMKIIEELKDEVSMLSDEKITNLRKIAQKQLRIDELQRALKTLQENQLNNQDKYQGITEQANITIKNLQDTIAELQEQCESLHAELNERQREIVIINSELQEYKNRGTIQNRSSFPSTAMELTGLAFMNGSVDSSSKQQKQEQKILISQLKIEDIANHYESIESQTDRSSTHPRKQSTSRRQSIYNNNSSTKKSFSYSNHIKHEQALKNLQQFYEEQLKQMTENKQELERKLKQQIRELKEGIKIGRQSCGQLQKSNTECRLKIKKMEDSIVDLKKQLEVEGSKNKKKIEILKQQLQKIGKQKQSVIKQRNQQAQLCRQLKSVSKELEKQLKASRKELEEAQTQNKLLRDRFDQKQHKQQQKDKQTNLQKQHDHHYKDLIQKYKQQINKITQQNQQHILTLQLKQETLQFYLNEVNKNKERIIELEGQVELKDKEIQILGDQLDNQRKDRTLRTVPSLASIDLNNEKIEQENYKEFYNQAPQKEVQIAMLEREVQGLKQEVQELKQLYEDKITSIQEQSNQYIQEIIKMKLIVAEAEMKASEKVHLYNQLKKRFVETTTSQ